MCSVFHLTILNFIIVFKVIYNGAVYWLLPTLPGKQFKLERSSKEKLKFEHFDGGVWNALILWNSENMWFCVCERESYLAATIMAKHVNIFGKLT